MIEPQIYEINIALANDKGNLSQNFFYQKFDDYNNTKLREVIRIVNDFPAKKPYIKSDMLWISTNEFNRLYDIARPLAESTGNSYNHELAILINQWFKERL